MFEIERILFYGIKNQQKNYGRMYSVRDSNLYLKLRFLQVN